MITSQIPATSGAPPVASLAVPTIYRLEIERFRGIKKLSWRPAKGVNLVLGGGDVGKTTILDALGLLFSPTNTLTLLDTDYYLRDITAEFVIEAVMFLPAESGVNQQVKPAWPWDWNGTDPVAPSLDPDVPSSNEPVYRMRVRGTEDLELTHEILQPDGNADHLSVALRRAIGLVRLGGDDRNDRDLRLVQGSALDRLLSDKSLRSRMAAELAKTDVKERLSADGVKALGELDAAFKKQQLPDKLDLSITGGQGASIASLVGLTAACDAIQLPLGSWGAGTRRLAALAIAEQKQGQAPITLVDEIERGLEPYRQRVLMDRLQAGRSQAFVTTHSPFAIAAGSKAAFWYLDASGRIGPLAASKIAKHRLADPTAFLSRVAVIGEGATEVGLSGVLLEKALGSRLDHYGVHVSDGGGNDNTLELLEALGEGGLRFAGFADNEGKFPDRWNKVAAALGPLLVRWANGCTEQNVIAAFPDDKIEALITDPDGKRTGTRLRSLADRLGIQEKNFAAIEQKAGASLRTKVIEAAMGSVPAGVIDDEAAQYKGHAQSWFKSVSGGRELADKIFMLGAWPTLKGQLLPFCNAIRAALDLPALTDIAP
jgi:putative ATP-dependent endonuclease of the OLD family